MKAIILEVLDFVTNFNFNILISHTANRSHNAKKTKDKKN